MQGRCIALVCSVLFLTPALFLRANAQQPAPAPQTEPVPQTQSAQATGSSSSKGGTQKHSHKNDFLIRGTVFNEKALAFPGAQLRIRRAGEKKLRWQDYTNSRGEFAIRVPQGARYEMLVRAKGFAEQTKTVDAQSGISDASLVFRLEPTQGGKK